MRYTDENGALVRHEWKVAKYGGGTYCGVATCATLDQCFAFANDGFCDYCRITSEDGDVLRLHFKTTNQDTCEPMGLTY